MRISAPVAYILLYAALYAAFGVASPFWPRFFETRGLSPQEIGIVLAAAMVTRILAGPMVGMLADRAGSLRFALAVCTALAAASAAALLWAHSFALLLFIAVLQAASLAPTTSLADALSVNVARPRLAGKEFEYGWIRGSASLAFILGTLTMGQLISRTDVTPIIWMNLSLLVAAAGLTALLPPVIARSSPCTGGTSVIGELGELLRIPRFRMMIIVSSSIYGSHAMHDAFAVIWWSAAGIEPLAISILWSEAVAAEVVVFFLIGPALLHRLGARGGGRPGCCGRHCAVVCGRRDDLRVGAFNYPATARLYLCPASSRLDAHDADAGTRPSGRNRPIHLRVWLRLLDCRADALVGNSLRQVWRSGLSSDGPSMCRRTPACVAWFR